MYCDKGERGLPVIVLRQERRGFTSYCTETREKGVYQLLYCDKGERGLPVIVL